MSESLEERIKRKFQDRICDWRGDLEGNKEIIKEFKALRSDVLALLNSNKWVIIEKKELRERKKRVEDDLERTQLRLSRGRLQGYIKAINEILGDKQ